MGYFGIIQASSGLYRILWIPNIFSGLLTEILKFGLQINYRICFLKRKEIKKSDSFISIQHFNLSAVSLDRRKPIQPNNQHSFSHCELDAFSTQHFFMVTSSCLLLMVTLVPMYDTPPNEFANVFKVSDSIIIKLFAMS